MEDIKDQSTRSEIQVLEVRWNENKNIQIDLAGKTLWLGKAVKVQTGKLSRDGWL